MADNSTQTGADTIRDKDRAGVKTQIFGLDVGIGTGTEALMSSSAPMPTYDPDATTTGTVAMSATTNAVTTATLSGNSTVGFAISGTWTGTLAYEATINGTDWFAVNAGANATGTITSTATANGQGQSLVAGCVEFRIRCSVTGTGTASVTLIASAANGLSKMVTPLPTGTNTIGATVGTGTAGSPATGVSTVQGITGGTSIPVTSTPATSTTPTVSGVAASASSGTILASNTARKGATVQNHSTSAVLYLRLGSTAAAATSGSYTVALNAGDYYEVPFAYTGQLTGIWASATGFANVTEVT